MIRRHANLRTVDDSWKDVQCALLKQFAMLIMHRCVAKCIKYWSLNAPLSQLRRCVCYDHEYVCYKLYGGINMPYHVINAKIGPTDAVVQVRR